MAVYFIWRVGDNFQEKSQIYLFYFILLLLQISLKSEHSGLRPDVSSFVIFQ